MQKFSEPGSGTDPPELANLSFKHLVRCDLFDFTSKQADGKIVLPLPNGLKNREKGLVLTND